MKNNTLTNSSKKININNINNIQKIKKNYYLEPHTYSIQKMIKKQIIEKEPEHKEEYEHIEQQIKTIKAEQKMIKKQLQYNEKANYLEYTTLFADFEDCGICMYCPSEPYEPADEISNGPIINNETYTYLKNILYN